MSGSQVAWESARWYLTVSAFAWLMYPLVFRSMAALPSRGIPFVRPLGLLLAAIVPWWFSAIGITSYSTTIILLVPAVLGSAMWIKEARRRELGRFFNESRRQLIVYEVLTLLAFAGYVVFRCYNPAIQHTEKPMELAFLTSLAHAHSMPPPDPWFLGQSINYYYLGYLLMALPARIARIAPSHAFNLSLATLFATSACAAVGVAADLMMSRGTASRRLIVITGALAGIFLLGIGNLVTPIEFIQHPLRTLQAGWWQGVGWNASRVIVDGPNQQTINEFPAFSFVLGDLHPHVLDYPMFISSIGVGLALALSGTRRHISYFAAMLGGVLAAAIYATNSWDMPPALFLAAAGILIATIGRPWRSRFGPLLALVTTAFVTVFPFWIHYTPAIGLQDQSVPASIRSAPILGRVVDTIGIVTWPRTSTWEIFRVHGLFLIVILLFLASIVVPLVRQGLVAPRFILGGAAALFVASLLFQFPGLFWFVGPALLCGTLIVVMRGTAPRRYHITLVGLAFILLSVTEMVFLEDAFGDRMNTVFKLYFQVWAIFAISAAVALPLALQRVWSNASKIASLATGAVIGVVIIGAALYPPISAYRWTNGFHNFSGVDGLAYLQRSAPEEMAAVNWLTANSTPGDHILEAPGCSYGEVGVLPDNVFSMATGLETPLGWGFHEYQWRLGSPDISNQISQRKSDVKTIYDSPSSSAAQNLLKQFNVRFIIVGPIERNGYGSQCDGGAPYSSAGLEQLNNIGWSLAFHNAGVRIYERP